jgi:hypothetical protein
MTQVSQVSLVSLFHLCLRPGLHFNAGSWHIPRPRLRATTSAEEGRAGPCVIRYSRNPYTLADTLEHDWWPLDAEVLVCPMA